MAPRRPRRRSRTVRHPLLAVLALVTVVGVSLGVAMAHQPSATAISPTGAVAVAGLQYNVSGARPLDEMGDAPVIHALPPSLRRASSRTVDYGVFITVDNNGARTRPMARRFALIDASQHSFTPIALRRDSRFAYRATGLATGQVAPPAGSAPAQDGAEQGYPLVFRIPGTAAADGSLTLRVFDPTAATPPVDILVQSA
jgi:hypothetical protein